MIKSVVNIIEDLDDNLLAVIQDVPESWRECSVTGEWRPKEEFMKDGVLVRTNCEKSYNMSSDEMTTRNSKTNEFKKSVQYKNAVKRLEFTCDLNENSISVKDMIESLSELLANNPNARLVVTQAGYYADGKIASINTPELLVEGFYSIGHSNQKY